MFQAHTTPLPLILLLDLRVILINSTHFVTTYMCVLLAIISVAQSYVDQAESGEERAENIKCIFDIVAQKV